MTYSASLFINSKPSKVLKAKEIAPWVKFKAFPNVICAKKQLSVFPKHLYFKYKHKLTLCATKADRFLGIQTSHYCTNSFP